MDIFAAKCYFNKVRFFLSNPSKLWLGIDDKTHHIISVRCLVFFFGHACFSCQLFFGFLCKNFRGQLHVPIFIFCIIPNRVRFEWRTFNDSDWSKDIEIFSRRIRIFIFHEKVRHASFVANEPEEFVFFYYWPRAHTCCVLTTSSSRPKLQTSSSWMMWLSHTDFSVCSFSSFMVCLVAKTAGFKTSNLHSPFLKNQDRSLVFDTNRVN